jgi:hypothetical protein
LKTTLAVAGIAAAEPGEITLARDAVGEAARLAGESGQRLIRARALNVVAGLHQVTSDAELDRATTGQIPERMPRLRPLTRWPQPLTGLPCSASDSLDSPR